MLLLINPAEYINESAEETTLGEISSKRKDAENNSYKKDAYSLFVNKEYDKAKELLEFNKDWLIDFIHNHFNKLNSLSFHISQQCKPFDYLVNNIMNIREYSPALKLGSEVHLAAEKYFLTVKNILLKMITNHSRTI